MTNFVQIQSGNFRALVRPENLAKVEDKLAKVKPPVHSIPKPSARDRARVFPVYKPGMSTAQYVRRYEIENGAKSMPDIWQGLNENPAAQYDPLVPLCVEDANPDYIAGVDDAPVKPKRARKVNSVSVALSVCIEQMQQAEKLVDCKEFSDAIYAAQMALKGK